MAGLARLRSDLIIVRSLVDNAPLFTVKDAITGGYFRLREPEYWLMQQLDGNHTAEQIACAFTEKFGLAITGEDVSQFTTQLEKLFFLEDGRSEQELARRVRQMSGRGSVLSRILYIKVASFAPGRLLERLYRFYRPFHKRTWFLLGHVILAIGLGLLIANAEQFAVNLTELFSLSSIPLFLVALFMVAGLHEFAHAIICRHYGGEVREVGFMLMFFQPCFFCDVSDAWLFPRKFQRLAVTLAGPFFQLMLLAASVILWRVTMPGSMISDLTHMTAIVSLITFLFNFNPLIKLDGYYLLSDLLSIPNLRQKSFAYVGNFMKRHLLGWPVEPIYPERRQRAVFFTYAILASLYSGFLIIYVAFMLAQFVVAKFGGAGFLLLFVAATFILRQAMTDLVRGMVQHIKFMRSLTHKPIRLTLYLVLSALALVLAFGVPLPHRVSGEIITQPVATFALILNQSGMLESSLRTGGEIPDKKSSFMQMTSTEMAVLDVIPLVKDGQTARAGDTVAAVTSNQISQEIASGKAELQRLAGTLTLLKTPRKREEIAEANAQVEAAKTTYEQAVRDFTRTEELVARNLLAEDRLEAARAAMEISRAQLNNRRFALDLLKSPPRPEEEAVLLREIDKQNAHLDFLEQQSRAQKVVTPIGGIVAATRRADTIMTITDLAIIEILVPVSDFDINLVKHGQNVTLKVRSYPDRVFAGQVVRVPRSAATNAEGVRFPVAVVIDNGDASLSHGMTGYAKIEVGKRSLANLVLRRLLSILRVEFWSWW